MELLSVVLARSALLFEVDSLDPFGRLSAVEALAQIKERYGFAIVPQKPGESTTEKGAEFLSGRMGDTVIDRLTLFHNGIVVDTRSSTEESEKIADDFVGKARDILGSRVRVERRHLASQITFRSQLVLSRMNPVIEEICEEIQRTVGAGLKQEFTRTLPKLVLLQRSFQLKDAQMLHSLRTLIFRERH